MFVDQSFFSQVYGDITLIITFMKNNKMRNSNLKLVGFSQLIDIIIFVFRDSTHPWHQALSDIVPIRWHCCDWWPLSRQEKSKLHIYINKLCIHLLYSKTWLQLTHLKLNSWLWETYFYYPNFKFVRFYWIWWVSVIMTQNCSSWHFAITEF